MGAGTRTVGAAVESAVVDLGGALLADCAELRGRISSGETTEDGFYRELLHLLFGLFFGGLGVFRLCEMVVGSSFETTARRIRSDIDAAELGAAYESLLEMRLSVDTDSWEVALGRAGQHDRKASGSYYTPDGAGREHSRLDTRPGDQRSAGHGDEARNRAA